MEVIYPKVCGADVHKYFMVTVICDSTSIISKDFRILREFIRYSYKLTNIKSSEKNRFTNALSWVTSN